MRAHLTKIAIHTLIISLATPASIALAAGTGASDRSKSPAPATTIAAPQPSVETRDIASTNPSPVLAPTTLRKTLARAVADADPQGGRVTPQPATTKFRAQYGGGGKGQMITMLVSTVVGLAATVYMLRYMQAQQKNGDAENSRRR